MLKKLFVALLAAVLAVSGLLVAAGAAASGGFTVGTVQSLTLTADSGYTNAVTTKDPDAITALRQLLGAATESVRKPGDAAEVAVLQVTADKDQTFKLLRSGNDYVLQQDSQYRKVSYDAFNKLVNVIGTSAVYKYSTYPAATLKTDSEELKLYGDVGMVEGTYQYRRLSGKLNRVPVPKDTECHELFNSTGKLYIPTFTHPVGAATVQVKQSGKQVWEGSLTQAKSYSLPEKNKSYDVYIRIQNQQEYYSYDITYRYALTHADGIRFTVEGDETHLGEPVVFRVTGGDSGLSVAQYTTNITFSIPPKFFRQADGSQIMLFPVSYLNAAGQYWVEVTFGGEKARFVIDAKDKQWQRQDLAVSSATAEETILSQQANAEYERVIAPLRSVMDETRHWSGRFIMPVSDEKVTTQFGMVRYTNGQPTSTRHGALDLAVPRGTPVKATGAGRVLYAGFLQLTGNTVLVEHGYGLKSWYYHMDSLSVATGDMITQEQVIGTVGSTGFSTGPHLHFGMSVNNIFINPYTAIGTDLLS